MSDERLVTLGVNRRQAIVRLATAASGAAVAVPGLAGAAPPPGTPSPAAAAAAPVVATEAASKTARPPTDPDLVNPVVPWEKILSADELATTAALCDVILPADERSPAASAVDVHGFVDEWVSAPYPGQKSDRQIVRGGLSWLNTTADRRFGKRFVDLTLAQKHQICDDIASVDAAKPAFKAGARFFERMRYLTLLGFYTTLEGMKDLGYAGNVPAQEWKGPSPELLKHLKLG